MMLWIADASASAFVGTQMRHSSTLPCFMCWKVRLDSWSAFCYLSWLGLLCHMGEGPECLPVVTRQGEPAPGIHGEHTAHIPWLSGKLLDLEFCSVGRRGFTILSFSLSVPLF